MMWNSCGALAEKDEGHHGSEHRHYMKERRGAVGADQLHAAIETQIRSVEGNTAT